MNTSLPGTNRIRINKKNIISLLFLCLVITSFSQEIRISSIDKPLNKILIELGDNWGVMTSFDDRQLSTYKLTVNKNFSSPAEALDYLLMDLPLRYEIINGVYVIYPLRITIKPANYIISGRITDRTNHETLPFSTIIINNTGLISDLKGNFSFNSSADSIFSVKVSYLGYYILDTIVGQGLNYNFRLTPSVLNMKEVVVLGSSVARSIQTGILPGASHLNHKIAYYLPGYGDNSVFNLLRLQPGILAAGEQSTDLIIWGSYEGQSQYIFDGFTLYGMKNFNDNISAVNPFMAKDIKVLKGGYGAEYGEKVGGIVDISGIDGNRLSPSAQLCINNMTLNGLASVPFRKKSALVLAYRQTYYNLYNPVAFTSSASGTGSGFGRGWRSGGGAEADYYLVPDYIFRDINLKYSGSGRKSNYYISLYGGLDNFSYSFDKDNNQVRNITLDYREQNKQAGGSVFYGFRWKNTNISNLTVSFSSLKTERNFEEEITRTNGNQINTGIYERSDISINEINSRIDNKFVLTEKQNAEAGLGLIYYFTSILGAPIIYPGSEDKGNLLIPFFYLQDNITLFKKLVLRPGIRTDFHSISKKIIFQPRFSAAFNINDHLRINSAVGMYNQFVAKNMLIDTSGNYQFIWSVCDNEDISVINSQSITTGLSYIKNGFTIGVEGYMKWTGGITRFTGSIPEIIKYKGKGKTKGLDFFIKKDFRNQSIWASYTLSETLEHFPYFPTEEYKPAMHDQRHEIKLAGLAKIKSFHFSANYVFGSGLPDPGKLPDDVIYSQFYSRLDAAIIYSYTKRKIQLDAGISVLNVFNRENIRYSNYTWIPADDANTISFYSEPVPLTPTLFLKLYY
jgi:hypothetical protein